MYDSVDRDLNADDKQDQEINKSNSADRIFEHAKQLPTANFTQGTSQDKTELEKKTNIMNQSFGNNGTSKILLQSPDKVDNSMERSIKESPQKPVLRERFELFGNDSNPKLDQSAKYILKDIIEKDYKLLSSE